MQNIVLAGKFYDMPQNELRQRASDLLRQFEMFERRSVPARILSKGLKQRINIASALVHNPAILFLDEPMSGLDVQSQRLIRKLITEINSRDTTVFLTTHNINEANLLCDRAGIINEGNIVAIDRPEVLRKAYEQTRSVEVSFQEPIDMTTEINTELIHRAEKMGDNMCFGLVHKSGEQWVISHYHILNIDMRLKMDVLLVHLPEMDMVDIFNALNLFELTPYLFYRNTRRCCHHNNLKCIFDNMKTTPQYI